MNSQYKFTVLVVSYNPKWEKMKMTLDSIVSQTLDSYEIVIADDGSQNNLFSTIKEYFSTVNFRNYTLVNNRENQGTVKNLLTGINQSYGKYIKDIGPGDLLYDENTLGKLYDFMESNKIESTFGLIQGYVYQNGIRKKKFNVPYDIVAYKEHKIERIKKNILVFSDYICGAAMCYTKTFFKHYMELLDSKVIYSEDIFQVIAILDDKPFSLYDEFIVWYELDTGISHIKDEKWRILLEKDLESLNNYIFQFYNSKYFLRRKKIMKNRKIKNYSLRTMKNVIENLDAFIFGFRHFWAQIKGEYKPHN